MKTTIFKSLEHRIKLWLKSVCLCSVAMFTVLFTSQSVAQVAVETLAESQESETGGSPGHDDSETESYFDDNGYRRHRYRAPLPDAVPGGKVVRSADVQLFIEQHHPVLIDVLAVTLRTEALDFGISWLPDSPRQNIPGSVWLPNVGRAGLEPFMLKFFSDHLEELTGGDKQHPVLFYCIADCWMSWNAVKRAAEWGYSNLYWFPEGTDGWVASGGELIETEPESIIEYIQDAEMQ